MLEIIAFILISRYLAKHAKLRDESPGKWVLYGIGAWLLGEFVGVIVVTAILGTGRMEDISYLITLVIVGYGSGYLGFLLVRSSLENLPYNDNPPD